MRITVVTPTLDRRDYLARTGASVLSQAADGGHPDAAFDLEWVVVDGGSTDGSVGWLADLAAADPRVRYVSGPDGGQSDAINKGLAMAAGDVVAWLNADDLYAPGALSAVAAAFAAAPAAQWLVGRYDVIDAADRPIRHGIVRYKRRRLDRCGTSGFRRAILRQNLVPQPAVFWRRDFGRRVGPLDESLHWTMDYDLWLRMAAVSPPLISDRLLARFRHHAASKSGAFDRRQFDEGYAVARRHAGSGDQVSLLAHRLNVEKIVWAYRALRVLGR
jgi:glycosyltransferase involved in cell wall biosynthesis